MLLPQTILQNRYRIVRELARGGMGAVYEAIDERLSSKVALKEMLAADEASGRNAFEREAALLANLTHPNLPTVKDHFCENDGVYLVMQFIEGMDLAEWLDLRGGPFPKEQVLQWADTLLDILEYLHGHNPPILHRDIKPSNIKQTKDGRLYLLDFGLAKGSLGQMATYETDRSIRGGTPCYSPLEQLHGPGTDCRSDIYSLGATLFHLISGVRPADAGLRYQAMEEEEPDPLPTLARFASPNVAAAIEKSISISRKQRFGSAAEMRRELRWATEEDSRKNQNEEYARAEERRRLREEERQKTTQEGTGQVNEARLLQEADTKKNNPPEQNAALAPEKVALFRTARVKQGIAFAAGFLATVLIIGAVLFISRRRVITHDSAASSQNQSQAQAQPNPSETPARFENTPAGMAYVTGGTFMMGRNKKDGGDDYESPAHSVTVKPFYIDVYEVTNEDYERFLKATNRRAPQIWTNGTYAVGGARKPVTGVTWIDANDACGWVGKRLPTEEEWEFAARGGDKEFRYSWGNDWRNGMANANGARHDMAEVGVYQGASPFGVFDMIGNAWEWTSSEMTPYAGGKLPEQPAANTKVLRGGSFKSNKDQATSTYRYGWRVTEEASYAESGFRCAKDGASGQ